MKEEAIRLVKRFQKRIGGIEEAKEFALICVEEMLKACYTDHSYNRYLITHFEDLKKEIEAL